MLVLAKGGGAPCWLKPTNSNVRAYLKWPPQTLTAIDIPTTYRELRAAFAMLVPDWHTPCIGLSGGDMPMRIGTSLLTSR